MPPKTATTTTASTPPPEAPNPSPSETAQAHARRKEALQREAGPFVWFPASAATRRSLRAERRARGRLQTRASSPTPHRRDANTTPTRPPPPHTHKTKTDAHERAAVAEAAPRLAALLADAANEGAHAAHEAQTAIASEAALLSRELSRLGAQLPAWGAASGRLHEALKHAGDVAHFARRVSAEARALEEVLAEDAAREGEEEEERRRAVG